MIVMFHKRKKRQTRRSISVRGLTYQTLKDYCDKQGRSVSGLLEELIADKMREENQPWAEVLKAHYPRERATSEIEEARAAVFTF